MRLCKWAGRLEAERQIDEHAFVRVHEPQPARFLTGDLANDPEHDVPLRPVIDHPPSLAWLRQGLEMRLHRVDLGDRGSDGGLHLSRNLVRLLERELAGKLEV